MLKSETKRFVLSLGALVLAACGGDSLGNDTVGEHSQELSQGGVTSTLGVNDKWNSGYCATVTLANGSANRVTGWSVTLDLAGGSLSNLWSAKSSQSGSTLVVTPEAYNSSIASGSSTSFGFCVNGTSVPRITAMTVSGGGGTGSGGSVGTGGTSSSGGSVASGGTASGGAASGGAKTGGSSSGGAAAGGSSSGGTASGGSATGGSGGAPVSSKLRVVMSTDFPPVNVCLPNQGCPSDRTSDPDDVQSMVRFLLYSNEFDVEGLFATAATFAGVAKKQNILDMIALYAKVYDNLKKHDGRYPTPSYLNGVTFQGRNGTWGQSVANNIGDGKDSAASDALIAIVDKPDPRPVYVGIWGDASQVAQAIWKVKKTRSAQELDKFIAKLRIHQIAHQDDTIDWMLANFPKLFIVYSKSTYTGVMSGDLAWVNANIRNGHGPLAAAYPPAGISGPGVIEGDSPSFLILVSAARGLNNPEDPTQQSWGGQFKRDGSTNHYLDGPGASSISKWRSDSLADFAKRADWCVN